MVKWMGKNWAYFDDDSLDLQIFHWIQCHLKYFFIDFPRNQSTIWAVDSFDPSPLVPPCNFLFGLGHVVQIDQVNAESLAAKSIDFWCLDVSGRLGAVELYWYFSSVNMIGDSISVCIFGKMYCNYITKIYSIIYIYYYIKYLHMYHMLHVQIHHIHMNHKSSMIWACIKVTRVRKIFLRWRHQKTKHLVGGFNPFEKY